MGTWGEGITQDDVVLDVIGTYQHILKYTQDIAEATRICLENFGDVLEDEDEGPLVWLGIAKAQWSYGKVDESIIAQIEQDLEQENGLDSWKVESEKALLKRKQALQTFLHQCRQPNPKVRKIPKLVIRKPLFQDGNCLSLQLSDTKYGAAVVIKTDEKDPEYGKNAVVALEYYGSEPPSPDIFASARILQITYQNGRKEPLSTWCASQGFRSYKKQVQVVGKTGIERFALIKDYRYADWQFLFTFVKQLGENPSATMGF
ncbi:hypothetical protein [Paenibacillus methanolicus]|uniref:DUF4259 domain-containing protein n=1 Tax=Paenibacillus methanolicus TaxID=582686 RepID=A0A5S5C2D6_9BACL|nr:hypothetical protein [Paenibacillus methanolicus]TYP73319.1 hypothetical protein BCM02_107303 [Paenibacillus methanolicus]